MGGLTQALWSPCTKYLRNPAYRIFYRVTKVAEGTYFVDFKMKVACSLFCLAFRPKSCSQANKMGVPEHSCHPESHSAATELACFSSLYLPIEILIKISFVYKALSSSVPSERHKSLGKYCRNDKSSISNYLSVNLSVTPPLFWGQCGRVMRS